MGIIILPILLIAFIISIVAIVKIIKLLRSKRIAAKEIVLGLVVSLILFGLIVLSYIIEGRVWGLSPAFRLPFFMIFIPFGIYLLIRTSKESKMNYISNIILISIGLTGILGVIFNDIFFELIDYLRIEKYY